MPEFWKKNKKIILGVLIAAVVLAAAFFSGGSLKEKTLPEGTSFSEEGQTETEAFSQAEISSEAIETKASEAETAQGMKEETAGESKKTAGAATSTKPTKASQAETPKQETSAVKAEEKKTYSCMISISCQTLLSNTDKLSEEKRGLVPADGWILKPVNMSFAEGETVFDVLKRICRERGIHLEFSETPAYHSVYIEGIANFYEFDAGSLSGWMYSVNGKFPNCGASSYPLKEGDTIAWQYTLKQGKDIGGGV